LTAEVRTNAATARAPVLEVHELRSASRLRDPAGGAVADRRRGAAREPACPHPVRPRMRGRRHGKRRRRDREDQPSASVHDRRRS